MLIRRKLSDYIQFIYRSFSSSRAMFLSFLDLVVATFDAAIAISFTTRFGITPRSVLALVASIGVAAYEISRFNPSSPTIQ